MTVAQENRAPAFIVIIIVLQVISFCPLSDASTSEAPDPKLVNAFKKAKVIKLEVKEVYPKAEDISWPNLRHFRPKGPAIHIRPIVKLMLQQQGLRIVRPESKQWDATVSIDIVGTPFKRSYFIMPRPLRHEELYTRAEVEITVSCKAAGSVCSNTIHHSYTNPDEYVTPEYYRRPEDAPFEKALSVESFIKSTSEMLSRVLEVEQVKIVLKVLQAEDGRVFSAAARVLASMRNTHIVEVLCAALTNREWWMRKGAAQALSLRKDPNAVEPLIATLRDEIATVREAATWALGSIGDARAFESLTIALKDDDKSVRASAAWSLGEIRDPRGVKPLVVALRDKESGVRCKAAVALGKIEAPGAVDALIAALNDKDPYVVEYTCEALGMIGDSRAVQPLIAQLDNDL